MSKINMHRFRKYIILIAILFAAVLMTSCSKTAKYANVAENETITSLSPDGKYRAEAYGTITEITAGGLYPYEGIRILKTDNEDVIWELKAGGYTVNFIWSPDSQYVGIYYTGRIWGESLIVDINAKEQIDLPTLEEIASHYGDSVKPQEDRPDPYFEIRSWKDPESVIVDFRWTKENGEEFTGQYTFNIKTNEVIYQDA